MNRLMRPVAARLLAAFIAATVLASSPAQAFEWEELMKIVRQFEVVRDLVRKIRGREPAPKPPAPPSQTPAPDGTPAPVVGLIFKGSCVARDETGHAESAQIDVADGRDNALVVRIDIPKRGACRSALAAFQQTQTLPYVELQAKSNATYSLRVWKQEDRVTLVATACADKCTKGAFEYAWPVAFQESGACN